MAELSTQDVVNHSQSVGVASPIDVSATTFTQRSIPGDGEEGVVTKENGIHHTTLSTSQEEQVLEDGTAQSDTSRAEGSNGDAKSTDARLVRKLTATKPISFAKYSVPKVIAANAAKAPAEKGVFRESRRYNVLTFTFSCRNSCACVSITGCWPTSSCRKNHQCH